MLSLGARTPRDGNRRLAILEKKTVALECVVICVGRGVCAVSTVGRGWRNFEGLSCKKRGGVRPSGGIRGMRVTIRLVLRTWGGGLGGMMLLPQGPGLCEVREGKKESVKILSAYVKKHVKEKSRITRRGKKSPLH